MKPANDKIKCEPDTKCDLFRYPKKFVKFNFHLHFVIENAALRSSG